MHSVLRLSLWAAAAAVFATLSGICVSVRGESLGHEAVVLLNELDHSAALETEWSTNRSLQERTAEVADELLAGRLSLTEAADALHEAEVDRHGDFRLVLHAYPHLPEDEAAYCHALLWARRQLARSPARAADVLPRLRAEFAARFHHPPPTPNPPRP
jgi:hypothetical protein